MRYLVCILFGLTAFSASAVNEEVTDSLQRALQEVVVTANQPVTRLEGSTLVSTITGSNLQNVGTALDVLAQLPMLTVTDGSVGVVGRGNVEIYIDGRPMRGDEELRELLSGNVKKVELLMAPGAMYESTTGAVLKITTRRNFVSGISLTDQLQVDKRRKWSAMDYLGVSYRTGPWDFFLNGSYNHNNNLNKGVTTNTLDYEGRPTVVGSLQHSESPVDAGTVRAGVNYARGDHSAGGYYKFNPESGDFKNTGAEWLDAETPLDRLIRKQISGRSHLFSLYYEGKFAERFLLHADADYKHSSTTDDMNTSYPDASVASVLAADSRRSDLAAAKVYLTMPLAGGELTAGTQDSYTFTSLDYSMMNAQVEAYIPSALTEARQTQAALFASWSRVFGRLSLTAGLRYEYVDYQFKVDGVKDKDVSRRDNLLTPDLSLGYTFSDRAQLMASYRMSRVRPAYSQLTGSLSYVGRHEIEGGNPALRDERLHDFQIFGMAGDFMLQADYMRSIDTYGFVKQLYPADNLQLLMHPVNLNLTALSVFGVWNKTIGRWSPNLTAGVYRQWLKINGEKHNRPIFSYYFNNSFSLPGGWTVTANMRGQSRGDMHTNRLGATWFTMDASVGKTLLNKSLTVKLSATDLFNTSNNDWTMDTYGVFVDKRQSYDRRGVSLSVIYQFHPRKSKYKGDSANEAESNRL